VKQPLESPQRAEGKLLRSDDCIYEIISICTWDVSIRALDGYIFLKDIKEYIFSPYIPLSKKTNVYTFVNSRQTI
jgi:hypothetical protein